MQVDSNRAFLKIDPTLTGIGPSGVIAAAIPFVAAAASLIYGLSLAVALWLAVLLLALVLISRLARQAGAKTPVATSVSASNVGDALLASNDRDSAVMAVETRDGGTLNAVVGVIRFANYDAMAAYNAVAAKRVIGCHAARLHYAVGPEAAVSQISENCHVISFSSDNSAELATKQLAAIARVTAQEIVDADLTVLPDIHVGAAQRSLREESDAALVARAQAGAAALNRFTTVELSGLPASTALADRFAMEQALRQAVRNGELHLHYQPFVDTRTGEVVGAETLLRWRHPKLGDVSPATFVPLLEETGLIHEIGLWTLNSACRQLNAWRRNGRADLRLAVNLSAVQLQNHALKPLILRTVASHGLLPDALEIELTETAAMKDPVRTRDLFEQLREAGLGISIDDFGNGHSNLNYLKDLPFTKLKIDREFVSHIDTLPGSQAICKALVELGAGLGISVLAEGVERVEEVRMLEALGCTHFQGFYFSRGLSAAELTAKLDDSAWLANLKTPGGAPAAKDHRRTMP